MAEALGGDVGAPVFAPKMNRGQLGVTSKCSLTNLTRFDGIAMMQTADLGELYATRPRASSAKILPSSGFPGQPLALASLNMPR